MKINLDRAASLLVESLYTTDKAIAKKHGLSRQTIRNYRKRLETDNEFYSLFAHKRQLYESSWASKLSGAIISCVDFLERAAQSTEYTPEKIHAVAGSMKLLSQIRFTKQMLDMRFKDDPRFQDAVTSPEPSQMVIDQPGKNAPTISEDLTNE